MLHVGVTGSSDVALVVRQLVELGAVPATGAVGSATIDEPVIYVHDLSDSRPRPLVHLVIGVGTERVDDADVWLSPTAAVTALWHERIVPFAANLRAARRAPRERQPMLAAPDPAWSFAAARLIGRLQSTIGDLALRIDHIGSTSIPGLAAKDLVDIQVTVADLDVARSAAAQARGAGFVPVTGEWFGMDRFGVEHGEGVAVDADPGRPTNVNFRPVTAPVWREALLFRDWLRAVPGERDAYAAMKRALTERDGANVDDYGAAKMPWITAALDRAEEWARASAWS